MEVGDPGKERYPASVGLPIPPYDLSLFLDRVHMYGGVPHRGGLPGQPRWVTRIAGVSGEFSPCECWRWDKVMLIWAISSEF